MALELKEWLEDEADSADGGITLEALWEEMNSIFAENTGEELPPKKKRWVRKKFAQADADKNGLLQSDEVKALITILKLDKGDKKGGEAAAEEPEDEEPEGDDDADDADGADGEEENADDEETKEEAWDQDAGKDQDDGTEEEEEDDADE